MPDISPTDLIVRFRKLMVPHERRDIAGVLGTWIGVIAVALLPLGAPLVANALFPGDYRAVVSTPSQAETTLDQAHAAATGAVEAALATPPPEGAVDLKTALEAKQRIEALIAERDAGPGQQTVNDHKVFRLLTLFAAALVLYALLAAAVLFTQYRVIARHWANLYVARDRILPRYGMALVIAAPRVILVLTFCASLAAAFRVIAGLNLPGALGEDLGALAWWAFDLPAALAVALLLTVIGISAFATGAYARNFPEVGRLEKFLYAAGIDPVTADKTAPDLWKAMVAHMRRQFEDACPADQRDDPGKRADFARGVAVAAVNPKLPAARSAEIVKTLTLPVAVLMVVALVMMTLGFDVLEALNGGSDALSAAVAGSADAWLLFLGAGFTISLAAIYVLPLARILPFWASEDEIKENRKKPAKVLHIKSLAIGPDGAPEFLVETRKKSEIEAEKDLNDAGDADSGIDDFVETVLARHLGAGADKFATVMNAAAYGGAFQGILGTDLIGKFKQILTLLSPALFGTVLSLLG